jgi:hypothetical protein
MNIEPLAFPCRYLQQVIHYLPALAALLSFLIELVPKLIDYALKRMVRLPCLRWNKLLEKPVKSD